MTIASKIITDEIISVSCKQDQIPKDRSTQRQKFMFLQNWLYWTRNQSKIKIIAMMNLSK